MTATSSLVGPIVDVLPTLAVSLDTTENINFDEFTTGVTGSIGDSIRGPLYYPDVTITASPVPPASWPASQGGGWVVDGPSGWANQQTSGNNLFGTRGPDIELYFNTPVSDLQFDGINGNPFPVTYTVEAFDQSAAAKPSALAPQTQAAR
jgi:hypothetical protein